MCSFLFTNQKNFDLNEVNFLLQKRGPDETSILEIEGYTYIHNLLSITGEFTKQPLIGNDLIILFNGEIYNYKDFGEYTSDGLCISELFKDRDSDLLNKLDGEFAIFIHDKKNEEFILITDTFGTKPIYYSIEGNKISVSSYPDPIHKLKFSQVKKCEPNTILSIDSNTLQIKYKKKLYEFDLTQNKDSIDDWHKAFEDSVLKRCKNTGHNFVVPLSSGYDSGLISHSLNILSIDYISYSMKGRENYDVLTRRLSVNINTNKEIIPNLSAEDIQQVKNEMQGNVQRFYYGPSPDEFMHDGFDDPGASGLYYLLKKAKEKYGIKIAISGHGSDEIMSNIPEYGFKTSNPPHFTEDLNSIYPWGNFYYGSQWSYLMKEECVAGSLGIETRYPFLDRKVVQEYINLVPHLKNKSYKYPIESMFGDYPFEKDKIGFGL